MKTLDPVGLVTLPYFPSSPVSPYPFNDNLMTTGVEKVLIPFSCPLPLYRNPPKDQRGDRARKPRRIHPASGPATRQNSSSLTVQKSAESKGQRMDKAIRKVECPGFSTNQSPPVSHLNSSKLFNSDQASIRLGRHNLALRLDIR